MRVCCMASGIILTKLRNSLNEQEKAAIRAKQTEINSQSRIMVCMTGYSQLNCKKKMMDFTVVTHHFKDSPPSMGSPSHQTQSSGRASVAATPPT